MVLKIKIGLLLGTFLLCAGCVLGGGGEPASSIQVSPVKGAPVVYIHPREPGNYRRATVGVLPFRVPAHLAPEQGVALAALFRDVLLGKEIFPTVRQLSTPFADLPQAIEHGRRAGVDLVLAGDLQRAIGATELGGARAALAVRLINVRTGNTVWHIAQAVDQPMDHHDVGIWNRLRESFSPPTIRPSRGAPPLPNMLTSIAVDMAEVLAGADSVNR
ncbi:MAG: hypothetical protein U5J62_10945 [Desulfurivibrio sp.]|nr:hypothetical protein [Desulfurivibrio sp.]